MDWTQVLAIMGANVGVMLPMFFWLRSEGNADRREHAADRREITQILIEMKNELKDFHGKLCAIEERNKK